MKGAYVFLVLLMVALISIAAAQTPQDNSSTKCESWVMQFSIQSFWFSLESFQGSLISLKKNLGENHAIRFGISTDYITDEEKGQETVRGEEPSTLNYKDEVTNLDLALDMQYLWIFQAQHKIDFYTGLGPALGYHKSDIQRENRDTGEKGESELRKSLEIGLGFVAGVEWHMSKAIGLHAEYRALGLYEKYETTFKANMNEPVETSEGKTWRFVGDGVLFGLSVYL